jgi:formylmethanofuran dehydrogenase subunit E
MNDSQSPQKLPTCTHCGRQIQSHSDKLKGEEETLCSQCYKDLAFGDLTSKKAAFQGHA